MVTNLPNSFAFKETLCAPSCHRSRTQAGTAPCVSLCRAFEVFQALSCLGFPTPRGRPNQSELTRDRLYSKERKGKYQKKGNTFLGKTGWPTGGERSEE